MKSSAPAIPSSRRPEPPELSRTHRAHPHRRRAPDRTAILGPALALLIVVLGLLPIANWIAGGHSAPWYHDVLGEWVSGAAIVAGTGIVLALLSRRMPGLWQAGLSTPFVRWFEAHPRVAWVAIASIAFTIYLTLAVVVFDGRPLLIDEVVQLLQAQIFAEGSLWRPAAEHPEFFSSMHVVDTQGRVYAQFPAGGPAMLVPGVLIGAPWLVIPVCGAIAVVAFAIYLRVAEPRGSVALGACLLLAASPFVAFMAGSQMNHVPTLMWLLIGVAAMAHVMSARLPRPFLALLSGVAFAAAATIRPVDALAFSLPAGGWYLMRALRDRSRWLDALAAAVGIAIPLLALMWVNFRTTGSPTRFGYQVLWGNDVGLGFHAAPWGDAHTPARGLELVNLYLLRLQTYLFEAPLPSLLPVAAALMLTRRFDAYDRHLLISSGLVLSLYFAYWHDGYYLGPRFMLPLVPLLVLWTARLPALVRGRWGTGLAQRTVWYGYAVAALIAVAVSVPLRAKEYRNGMLSMRWDAGAAADRAGVRGSLVFVRESWGAQVIVRMWALGISRPDAELLYRNVDTCLLDEGVRAIERTTSARGPQAFAMLGALLHDSARVVKSTLSPDGSQRMLPGARYSAHCGRRLQEDRAGFTLLTPHLVVSQGDNIYARDLHERNIVLLEQYPDRPVYLLRPEGADLESLPNFLPLSRDSLRQAWRRGVDTGQGVVDRRR